MVVLSNTGVLLNILVVLSNKGVLTKIVVYHSKMRERERKSKSKTFREQILVSKIFALVGFDLVTYSGSKLRVRVPPTI